MNSISPVILKRSRRLYIIEAALEHLISVLVTGSFLATLTKELGFSDSLTGIMSSVISLGCLFQLLSLSVRRKHKKSFVLTLSVLNQLLFFLLYVVPLTGFKERTKITLFFVLIFFAYFLYNFARISFIRNGVFLLYGVCDRSSGRRRENEDRFRSSRVGDFCTYAAAFTDNDFNGRDLERRAFGKKSYRYIAGVDRK